MPTYQYQCTECGNALEVRQSFTDDALTVCPNCDGALRKVFNAVGVVFKGSGFYRNDSRSTGTSSIDTSSTRNVLFELPGSSVMRMLSCELPFCTTMFAVRSFHDVESEGSLEETVEPTWLPPWVCS